MFDLTIIDHFFQLASPAHCLLYIVYLCEIRMAPVAGNPVYRCALFILQINTWIISDSRMWFRSTYIVSGRGRCRLAWAIFDHPGNIRIYYPDTLSLSVFRTNTLPTLFRIACLVDCAALASTRNAPRSVSKLHLERRQPYDNVLYDLLRQFVIFFCYVRGMQHT